ncbi:MAG: hypothetical protein AUI14_03805 [Actinobacteria bacterium 13_2_20CM_2_71_6]|nr:MAG: hypothetical protein AUI14_03805 [Actinobacteria bacterium 13_2_20CM_2_71_6]
MLGEVNTGLLQHSTSVSSATSSDILRLRPGEPVRWSLRPSPYAVSPDLLTGVDCRLPTRADMQTRCVGTATSRAVLVGGRILQGSASVRIGRSRRNRRLPWSYYLSRPGCVESVGKLVPRDVAAGFAAPGQHPETVNLGAIGARAMNTVQEAAELDRQTPFRMARTRLRWIVVPAGPDEEASVSFAIDGESRRTLLIRLGVDLDTGQAHRIAELCEDLALHDWLLTALSELIERSRIGAETAEKVVARLKPAIDDLLHLWMPAARVDRSLRALWESLERRPGFSRQWTASVNRVRDQVALTTIAMLSALEPKVTCA